MTHSLGRSVLLGGNPARWTWESKPDCLTYDTGIDAWPLALQGHRIGGRPPSGKELDGYDLVMANSNEQFVSDYIPIAEARPSRQKWVTLVEGDCRMYWRIWPEFRRLLNASDLVISINALTVPFFQALTSTPVVNIGIPYPVTEIAAMGVSISERSHLAMVCNKEDHVPSVLVGMQAGIPMEMFVKKVSRQVKNLPFFLKHRSMDRSLSLVLADKGLCCPKLRVCSHNRDWRAFLAEAARYQMWINMDPRYTWGRYVLDSAALRIPIVTTESTAQGSRLFPETTVRDCFDTERAVEIARRIWSDAAFAARISEEAYARVWDFAPEKAVARLEAALHP